MKIWIDINCTDESHIIAKDNYVGGQTLAHMATYENNIIRIAVNPGWELNGDPIHTVSLKIYQDADETISLENRIIHPS